MWKCNACGEEHENQFETCWKCEDYKEPKGFNELKSIETPGEIKSNAKLFLIVCTIIFGTIGVVAFFPLLLSGMVFDAPGSDLNLINWVLFISLFIFSPLCLLFIFVSWGLYSCGFYDKAKKIFFLPVINILVALMCVAI